jgi:hypothetical protein
MSMPYKRIVLGLSLLLLGILELWLATAYLPAKWQAAVGHAVSVVLPRHQDQSAVTHSALDQEIDQALRENIGLRLTFYAVVALLLAGNAALIVWVTRRLRSKGERNGSRQTDPYARNT